MTSRFRVTLGGVAAIALTVGALCLNGRAEPARAASQALPQKANVFVHPEKLTAKDKLTDGNSGKPMEIKSETTLIWVDLHPDARFAHATEFVLISAEGTRVIKGNWWPVLNDKPLFRGEAKSYKAEFPVQLLAK
jgi:hypothetical protein